MRNQHIHTNYRAGDRKSLKAHKRLRFGEQLELDYNHYDFYCFNRRFTYVPAPKAGNDLYVHTKEHGNSQVTSLADPEAQGTVLTIYSHGYDKDKKIPLLLRPQRTRPLLGTSSNQNRSPRLR